MSTTRRRPLSRERVVQAAVTIADRDGLEALSMRKVAASLRCEVMSLYNHVANKDDLLDEMIDHVFRQMSLADDGPWQRVLRTMAVDARQAFARHPWAADLVTTRYPGPARRRHMEDMLRILAGAGLPEDVADLGFHALMVHIQGFSQQAAGFAILSTLRADEGARYVASLAAEEHPYLAAHIRYHHERGHRHSDFEFVLDLIIDGLERAPDPGSRGQPARRRTSSASHT
jgi:AcrR family transcriptional regulator